MMPFRRSLETGLAGLSRFIERSLHRGPSHTGSAGRGAVARIWPRFRRGRVKGPPPLTCANAIYSSGVTYLGEAFGEASRRQERDEGETDAPWQLLPCRLR